MKNRVQWMVPTLAAAGALLALLPAARAADIYGTITFQGTPPPEINIVPLKNDPNCGPMHKEMLHNVHVTPENPANPEENRAQLPHGPDLSFAFKAPEEFIRFKCDVHPWMFAYVSVFDNPYFAVSDAEGSYRIHNVPPGHDTVVAAHRKAGTQEKTIDVQKRDVELDFTFAAKSVS